MILFEYLEGRTSPAQWHRDAGEHDAMKWLGRGVHPSRTAWYDFRDRMARVIHELNGDIIRQAVDEQLVNPKEAAQDGTTFRSNASRHRAVNQETLEKRLGIIEAAREADLESKPPPQPQPKWMPSTVDGRLGLHDRMLIAQQVLGQRSEENAKKPKNSRREDKNIVVSLTDPIAPFARDKEKTFCFLYVAQFMVDVDSLLVLNYSVAPENTDVGTLAPMIDRVQVMIRGTLETVSADASYSSLLDLQDCVDRNIDLLAPVQENSFTAKKLSEKGQPQIHRDQFRWIPEEQTFECPEGHKLEYHSKEHLSRHGGRHVTERRYQCPPEHCVGCPLASRCAKNPAKGRSVRRLDGQDLIDAQREKMQQDNAKVTYQKRGQTVERAFADAKAHRSFRKFHGRGLDRAKAETGLLVMAQNILVLHRLRANRENTEK